MVIEWSKSLARNRQSNHMYMFHQRNHKMNNLKKPISISPERHSFGVKSYKERLELDSTDKEAADWVEYYQTIAQHEISKTEEPSWRENNLEYDLRSTEWILAKVRGDATYAQNLYAALCNNSFRNLHVIELLKETQWSCSWRYAGGIIAHMCQRGDYMDYYCSGIGEGLGNGDSDGTKRYVSESVVTDEIKADLESLGWTVLPEGTDEF
jgi:hypothetical protein